MYVYVHKDMYGVSVSGLPLGLDSTVDQAQNTSKHRVKQLYLQNRMNTIPGMYIYISRLENGALDRKFRVSDFLEQTGNIMTFWSKQEV